MSTEYGRLASVVRNLQVGQLIMQRFTSRLLHGLLPTQKDDICVVCTDPPLLSVSAALPVRFRRAHLVNWVMDLFPETAIELGLMKHQNVSGRLAVALRNWSMRQSALTICPIDKMARYLSEKGIPSDSLAVVHHWADKTKSCP